MTDVAVDTVRLRGPGAQRLARVAATTLPAALDRALSDVGDVHLTQVTVRLDLVVDDHDDETLAVLWADAIRAQVVADGGARPAHAPAPAVPTGLPAAAGAPWAGDVVAAARQWVLASRAGRADLPAAVVALADPQVAGAVRRQLQDHEWRELIGLVASSLEPRPRTPWPPPPTAPAPARAGSPAAADLNHHQPAPTERTDGAAEQPEGVDIVRDTEATVLAGLAGVAQVAPPSGGPVVLADLTRAAGLVLLYPWLADHCRRAEALHPRLDPVDVREAALAVVVDPEDPTLVDDPLVRLLAGRPLDGDGGPRARMPLSAAREVAQSAGSVLSGFAALLPGFERSSERFVRESWVARVGLLDTERDPVLLTAATHPLDVLLPRLPYPVGLLKLPWSPPVTVRFR
ncbi:contractile injection system tape measure protein [Terrabacter sp. GCM10028922]|uniref:contractile injection system tape measure protein n=1 Tax=Terrabacter sp. GCM10028922 TaxID=3273428 RepID=UPI00360676A6